MRGGFIQDSGFCGTARAQEETMSAVRFSVVIPTRERADTLRFALHTCLDQAFDDYEIVVSDNFSSPATRAVVEEAASAKVRYVRTAEPVAMSANWEYGVAHARGEYVLVVGDDDGLLPHALAELDRLARRHPWKAIRWGAAFYTWPTVALVGQGNYLRLSLGSKLKERDGADVIREVAEFREFYTELPMLYNSAVHRDVLDSLRASTGRVFPHPIPDVYSGFAVAHAAGRFLSTDVPMSVSGQSRASNGIAMLFNRGRSEIDREFYALNARAGLLPEPTVPDLPVFPHVPVADAFTFAKRALFPDAPAAIDRRALTAACVAGARVVESDWPAALAAVRASLADVPELQKWFDAGFANAPYCEPSPMMLRPMQLGFDGEHLHLDTAAFGVSDVAGAARLCEQLLHYRGRSVEYIEDKDDSERDRRLAAKKIAELTAVCDERERAILQLHLGSAQLRDHIHWLKGVCDEREAIINSANVTVDQLSRQLSAERRWSIKRPLRALRRLASGARHLLTAS
jgi:hypothetical protein